jgi:hypothetical protein
VHLLMSFDPRFVTQALAAHCYNLAEFPNECSFVPQRANFRIKIMRSPLYLISIVFATLLSGCATPPSRTYSLPDDVPAAFLTSAISGAYGRNESIDVYIKDKRAPVVKEEKFLGLGTRDHSLPGPDESRIFSIVRDSASPTGYIRVPGGERFFIRYFEVASGGRTCMIFGSPILEPGKRYRLVGGFEYLKGPIPLFTDTRKCSFGVVDEETGLHVPLRPDSPTSSKDLRHLNSP